MRSNTRGKLISVIRSCGQYFMQTDIKTRKKAAKDLRAGERILTSAGFITISEVCVCRDGAVEVLYTSLEQVLTVQTVIDNGYIQVTVAAS